MASSMIASLPMYDSFLTYESSNCLWEAIRDGSERRDLPETLDKFACCSTVWKSGPQLTLTQSCGYPLVREYFSHLKVVATPLYAAAGCSGTNYRSALIVRSSIGARTLGEYLSCNTGLTIAVNSFGSFSGWLMLLSSLADSLKHTPSTRERKIKRVVVTGSHIGSLKAVQDGTADIACIDCVSFALARNHCPLLTEGIRVIGWGLPAPALPYVTHSEASAEDVAALRKGLTFMMQSTKKDVMEARQHHLLAGVDTSGDVDFGCYQRAVSQHVAITKSHFETSAIFDALLPGAAPRDNYTVLLPACESLGAGELRVDLTSRLGDATWPIVDTAMVHGLKRHFARYLWNTIHEACCRLTGMDEIGIAARSSPIESVLTVDVLVRALLPIVGQQLWPLLPDGGKPKLIFCSLRGTLLLLRNMYPDYSSENSPLIYNSSADDICSHPTWKLISEIARAALKQTCGDNSEHVIDENAGNKAEHGEEAVKVECDPYWAGFMGAGVAEKYSFDDMVTKLWSADINLSAHLINSSKEGKNGMIAYISAPRFNDRNDWSNLVITEDEASIERWRDSRGHTCVRTHVAPWSYEHIRLHRGILTDGLTGARINLKRTVFIGTVEKKCPDGPAPLEEEEEMKDDCDMDQYEKTLSALRIVRQGSGVNGSGGTGTGSGKGCTAGAAASGRGLVRKVVYWADIPPHDSSRDLVASTAPNAPRHPDADIIVPGGVLVTLSEFKAQLLDSSKCPYVTTDETIVSSN